MAARIRLGISRYRLAKSSGMNATYLSFLEHGAYDPRVSTVFRISRALGISAGVILDEQERLEDEDEKRNAHDGFPIS